MHSEETDISNLELYEVSIFPLFLRISYWILELFWLCAIFVFR